MAGNSSRNVGYKRVITIAIVSTAFAIFVDKMGWINKLSEMIPGAS